MWFSVVNNTLTPPHPTPHPSTGHLFTTSHTNNGPSVCDIMSKRPANRWDGVHGTRWWWCEVMCPWGGVCVPQQWVASCHGYIPAWCVSVILQCLGTVLSCHFWSHREDSSSCTSENCATHTSITRAHTDRFRHMCLCASTVVCTASVQSFQGTFPPSGRCTVGR